ncbi:hypothetical protein V492_06493 [Pseudogymnoascus sp. VKM F-4246]|nr:hypothetical protein V492_06493 [Pseudogymnoascus sp. VKM F-4246]
MHKSRSSTGPSAPITLPPSQIPTLQPVRSRPTLKIPDLEAGCIVWLPSKDLHSNNSRASSDSGGNDERSIRCIHESCCGNADLEEEGYNHPVVVLKTSQYHLEDMICFVAIITSKPRKDRRLDRLPISHEEPSASLPNGNSDSNTTITTELYLENNAKMNKQSYILLKHIFKLHASHLRSLSFRSRSRATDTRLREESYVLLMSQLPLQRGLWTHTASTVCKVGASSPRSKTTEGRRAGRTRAVKGGRRYADALPAVARPQPQTPQSAPVERVARQVPNKFAAAPETVRVPGAWEDAGLRIGGGGGLRGYGYGGTYDRGERHGRWEVGSPRNDGGKRRVGILFMFMVVLLAVVAVWWWMWM